MKQLPGRDYQVFFANPDLPRDMLHYEDLKASRFMVTDELEPWDRENRVSAIRMFVHDYELLSDVGGVATLETVDGVAEIPSWTVGEPLSRPVAPGDRMVLVRSGASPVAKWHGARAAALREVWSRMRAHPDVRFVVSGDFNYQLWFLFGFGGGAVTVRRGRGARGKERGMVFTDGVNVSFSGGGDLSATIASALNAPIQASKIYKPGSYYRARRAGTRKVMLGLGKMSDSDFTTLHNSAAAWSIEGDRIRCDQCSLQHSCTLFQEGSVCALPSSEGRKLAGFFETRDSRVILQGVSEILQFQADRFERLVEDENAAWEAADKDLRDGIEGAQPYQPSPAVSKMANDLQRNAAAYAKLVDPTLTRPQIAVQINNGTGAGPALPEPVKPSPKMLASAVRELEAEGHDRGVITKDMIYAHLSKEHGGAEIIEGDIVGGVKDDF